MRVLGIDPGTLNMGYGILDEGDDVPILVHCGVLKAFPRDPLANRLQKLYNSLTEILFHYSPNQVAIEEPFVHRNVRSAMMLGGAKAIALLGAVNAGAGIFEYTPRQVKQSVTSYGGSDKKQVCLKDQALKQPWLRKNKMILLLRLIMICPFLMSFLLVVVII